MNTYNVPANVQLAGPERSELLSYDKVLKGPFDEEASKHPGVRSVLIMLTGLFPDSFFYVPSLQRGKKGWRSPEHVGGAFDIAPVTSQGRTRPDGRSPNLCDNVEIASRIASYLAHYPDTGAVFLEDDHFHCDPFYTGVYLAPNRHSTYASSRMNSLRKGVYTVSPSGNVRQVTHVQISQNPNPHAPARWLRYRGSYLDRYQAIEKEMRAAGVDWARILAGGGEVPTDHQLSMLSTMP